MSNYTENYTLFLSTAKFDYEDPINIDSCLKEEEKIVRYCSCVYH